MSVMIHTDRAYSAHQPLCSHANQDGGTLYLALKIAKFSQRLCRTHNVGAKIYLAEAEHAAPAHITCNDRKFRYLTNPSAHYTALFALRSDSIRWNKTADWLRR